MSSDGLEMGQLGLQLVSNMSKEDRVVSNQQEKGFKLPFALTSRLFFYFPFVSPFKCLFKIDFMFLEKF